MNLKPLIAAAAVLATTPVFAGEWVEFTEFVSTKTRAEVSSELKQAQADGTLAASKSEYVVFTPMIESARSRAEVRAEAIESAKHRSSDVKDIYFGG